MSTFGSLFANRFFSFYISKILIHYFVLFLLLTHNILVRYVIDVQLSVFVYFLCFCAFTIDGLYLFFYKKNQKKYFLNNFLIFLDALFISGFLVVMDLPFNLFFSFFLIFFQLIFLTLFQKTFQTVVFFLSISVLFPMVFMSFGLGSLNERLFLVIFVNIFLLFLFLFHIMFKKFFLFAMKEEKFFVEESVSSSFEFMSSSHYRNFPLEFCKKMNLNLNMLSKYFAKEFQLKRQASYSKGIMCLEQVKNYIEDFIEYVELKPYSSLEEHVDLDTLLKNLLKKMGDNFETPQGLIQNVNLPKKFKIKGSSKQLEKAFGHILKNSFEALRNQSRPIVTLYGEVLVKSLFIEISDNGHGIEQENMNKLFDPLFSQRFGLKGIGLPYVQKVMKIHKAQLDISSSKKGTKVRITFPLKDFFYDKPYKIKRNIA